jgi:exonuclease SbcC
MKPVSLKLAGLHSFREPQAVDFERLCEAGLFGIFGPTGSGKSTVLDAITLALYGRVERAIYGTQGILNHAGDRVLVEFTFELNQPEGRKRYRLERLYRRSGDNSVTSGGARLVEIIDGHEKPLAEKSRVTEEITSMLGLTADDFTRAVVLPQGKFDEFLKKIKPLERRRMLERLFGLSDYGDKLRQKVDFRLGDAKNRLASVQGELEGLGDASDAALAHAQKQMEEAGQLADKANKLLQQAEKEYKEMEQVWAWQIDKAAVDQSLAGLQERRPEIEAARLKLDAAVRAGKLAPYLQEADEAEKGYAEAQGNHSDTRERLTSASQSAEAAENAFNVAYRRRRQEEPVLLDKKARLTRAVELEKETGGMKKEESGLAKDIKDLEEQNEKNKSALQNRQSEKASLEQKINQLKKGIAGSQVNPERRRQVSVSLLALQKWQNAGEEKKKGQADRDKKEGLLLKAQKALSEAISSEQESFKILVQAAAEEKQRRESRPEDEVALQNSFREWERLRFQAGTVTRLYNSINEALFLLESKNVELEKAGEAARKAKATLTEAEESRDTARRLAQALEEKITELRRRNMACYLAQSLKEGAPCPVCGSADHPAPAVTDRADEIDAAGRELREAQESAEAAQRALEKSQRDESTATANLNAAAAAAGEARSRLDSLQADMDAARGSLPADWSRLSPEELEHGLAGQEARLARRQQALVNWRKNLEEAQKALKSAQDLHSDAKARKAGAESDRKGAESALQEAVQRTHAAALEAESRLTELDAVRGDIAADRIMEEQKRIERLDAERLRLEKERGAKETKFTAISAEIDKMAAMNADLGIKVAKSREKLEGIRDLLREKENELLKITGGQPAGILLEQAGAALKDLAAAEQQAQEEMKRAARVKGELDQALAAAEKALRMAGERLEKAQLKLNKMLGELHFVTRNEAEQALLGSTEQAELQQAVDDYRKEKERLAGLSRNLEEKLGGRKLSPEEWQGFQDRLGAARREHEEALTARGAAAQEYQKLTADNARWKELSRRASEISGLKAKLDILKDLLRSNAFVDFLAEEQLVRVANGASVRLGQLTRHRYALEVDSEGGFIIRDEANGGVKRPVSTLSGGETFVTSLALALALSAQIQLKGRYPLEFFFLDEGFGTLDPDLLEVVVSTLETLRLEHLNIGVISHLPELKHRLPRRLIVHPAEAAGAGSRLVMEMA